MQYKNTSFLRKKDDKLLNLLYMKIIDAVEDMINRFPNDYIFTYSDFNIEVGEANTIVQTLKRLAAQGKIQKLSKGKFYKARKTELGLSQTVGGTPQTVQFQNS